ncbi:DUF397 domain-containing protein [Streptomyces venezuelae]|uniref:DUF397 domain-containing protein n=1 Tax=Streptomyces venezuelae TaxID=54571 RepID=A0A5P2CT90_STRVZ|nr:DUF397 domain-containing protein [Streptomyces venezuelae]QES46075.1 DUF397 domain-containing protein [Streptomyces venezuelae]
MGTSQKLTGIAWRKSSYSSDTGGECIELAQAQCNETVAVRDSKNPTGPTFTVTRTAFTHFIAAAASGDLTRPAR